MDDLISRQDAIDALDGEIKLSKSEVPYFNKYLRDVIERIKELPSVAIPSAEPKTAHWIAHPKGIYAHLICDNCLSNAPYDCRTNYCPNCGFRMVEPQERSE